MKNNLPENCEFTPSSIAWESHRVLLDLALAKPESWVFLSQGVLFR